MVRRSPHAARHAATWLSVGLVLLVGAVALSGPVGASVGGRALPAQTTTTADDESDPPPTEPPPTTAAPTTAAPTTASTLPTTTAPPLEDRATESEDATTRLNRVVLGLIALAVLIAAATVYFWIRTRPDRSGGRGRAERGSGRRRSGDGRVVRTGAVVISEDGTAQPLVDPGPAALADDAWRVDPAPRLPSRSADPASAPSADEIQVERTSAPRPAGAPSSGGSTGGSGGGSGGGDSWWASQSAESPGSGEPPSPDALPDGGEGSAERSS